MNKFDEFGGDSIQTNMDNNLNKFDEIQRQLEQIT